MINNPYMEYLKGIFTSLQANNELADDIKIGFHSEIYYDYQNDVEITVSQLAGQITKSIIQNPYMLYIDIKDEYLEEFKARLDELCIDLNETIITLDSKSYKQFYTTSAKMGAFKEIGANKYATLVVNVTLIECSSILTLDTLSIGGTSVIAPLVSYGMSYEAETISTGAIGDAETKSSGKTYLRTWSYAFVINTSNSGVLGLLNQAVRGTAPNTSFSVVSKFTYEQSATTETFIIKTAAIDHDLTNGSIPILRVVLVKGV